MGAVVFGDEGWSDYDFTFEASKSTGPGGFGASFHTGDGKQIWLRLGDENNHGIGRVSSPGGRSVIRSKPGTIRQLDWYKVKISLRGPHIRVDLDDHLLFSLTDKTSPDGLVGLRFINSAGRFRNIKVTAPDGTVLWEGPPDLPKK